MPLAQMSVLAISTEELYTAAVGERAARYYVPKFLAFKDGTKRFSFNFWALLFGAFWFCYRRMWISALVLWIGGIWVVRFLTSTTLLNLGLSQLATPIISIVSTLYIGVVLQSLQTTCITAALDSASPTSARNSWTTPCLERTKVPIRGQLGRPGSPGIVDCGSAPVTD